MPKTIRATVLGFCPGVRRAVDLVETAIESGDCVATLGPIVHNSRVVEALKRRGVTVDEHPSSIDGKTLISRSHGITKHLEDEMIDSGARYTDGTCPKVSRVHRAAAKASESDSVCIVIGDPVHPEVKGIVSRCPGAVVIGDISQMSKLEDEICPGKENDPELVVIAQTTVGRGRFEAATDMIKQRFPNARIIDSVCPETDRRIQAVRELAHRVDAIVVVGGLHSSNTRKLFDEARASGLPSWHVEDVAGLLPVVGNYEFVGVSAGASTPDLIVDEIERAINGMKKESTE